MRAGAGLVVVALMSSVAGCERAPQSADLVVTSTSERDVAGIWRASPNGGADADRPWLWLEADGTLEGFDGCNGVTGTWSLAATAGVVTTDARLQSHVACLSGPTVSFSTMRLRGGALEYAVTDAAGQTGDALLARSDGRPAS